MENSELDPLGRGLVRSRPFDRRSLSVEINYSVTAHFGEPGFELKERILKGSNTRLIYPDSPKEALCLEMLRLFFENGPFGSL